MPRLGIVLALLAFTVACSDQSSGPSDQSVGPAMHPQALPPHIRPSFTTTTTSVTVDLDGSDVSGCVFGVEALNHFPPLVFPSGQWFWNEHGCFGEQGRNGSSLIWAAAPPPVVGERAVFLFRRCWNCVTIALATGHGPYKASPLVAAGWGSKLAPAEWPRVSSLLASLERSRN